VSKRPQKKKKTRPKPSSPADSDMPRRRARVILETLEVTRGHDGFLRGKPEPVLLVAAYRTNGVLPASLVSRLLLRARIEQDMPCRVELAQRELRYDARFADEERLLLLVFAVEENGGEGVASLYAAFENPGQLLIYDASEAIPNPRTLEEWAKSECSAPCARPIEVLLAGSALAEVTDSDQFIAASAFSVFAQARSDEAWRLPFLARDARNDWTLLLRMRID